MGCAQVCRMEFVCVHAERTCDECSADEHVDDAHRARGVAPVALGAGQVAEHRPPATEPVEVVVPLVERGDAVPQRVQPGGLADGADHGGGGACSLGTLEVGVPGHGEGGGGEGGDVHEQLQGHLGEGELHGEGVGRVGLRLGVDDDEQDEPDDEEDADVGGEEHEEGSTHRVGRRVQRAHAADPPRREGHDGHGGDGRGRGGRGKGRGREEMKEGEEEGSPPRRGDRAEQRVKTRWWVGCHFTAQRWAGWTAL